MKKSSQDRISELLLRIHGNDQISEAERKELNDLLREGEENRDFAVLFLLDTELLTESLATGAIADISSRKKRHLHPEKRSRFRVLRSPVFLTAATLLGVLTIAAAWIWIGTNTPPMAVIKDRANAKFGGETVPADDRLVPAAYNLQSGMVQIGFRNGVTMTVRGPARFEIVNEFRVKLQSGWARAFAPESGHGFTIQTPEAELIDLGTEFGISVDKKTGASTVQVF